MTPVELVADIRQAKKTGVLSLAVQSGNALIKLYFDEGIFYHIACGEKRGAECFAGLSDHTIVGHSFLPKWKVDVRVPGTPSTDELLAKLATVALVSEPGGPATPPAPVAPPVSRPPPPAPVAAVKNDFDAQAVGERLKAAFIRQLGPAGSKVFGRHLERRWGGALPLAKPLMSELVEQLKEEIEDANDRGAFIKEALAIIG